MAGLPPFRKISLEDVKDAPAFIRPIVDILNSFMEFLYGALNRNLSIAQNLRQEFRSFTVEGGATADLNKFRFSTAFKSKPSGVMVLSCVQLGGAYVVLTSAVTIPSWRWESGEIIIESITGLTSGQNYSLAILVTYD